MLCDLGELPPGASARITLVVRADLAVQFPTQIANSALASAFINEQYNEVFVTAHNTLLPSPAITSAAVSGKKLPVNGLNFAPGAVVEINGTPKATKAGEPSSAALIAKKGGKQIAPGETVRLTFLNPDGVRAAPFAFTRPAP